MKKYYNGFYSVTGTKTRMIIELKESADWNRTLQELCLRDMNPDCSDDSADPVIGWNQKNATAEISSCNRDGANVFTLNCVTNEMCDVDAYGIPDNFEIVSMCDFSQKDINWLHKMLGI